MIETMILDGTVTLIALAVLALELAALLWIGRRGHRVADVAANAFAGAFLILALRSSVMEHGPVAIAAFLALAFVAHVAGLVARFGKRRAASPRFGSWRTLRR